MRVQHKPIISRCLLYFYNSIIVNFEDWQSRILRKRRLMVTYFSSSSLITILVVPYEGNRLSSPSSSQLPTPGDYYSRTPLNPYLSVDDSGYGLLEVMGYEGSILV